nr:translocation/assembly module TamB domain-containing protein [Pontibacter ruber]
MLFGVVFVAIRYPGVQTRLAQKAAEYLSRTLDHEVTIGRVDIEFFSNVVLEKVSVLDYRDKELFYVGRAEADISLFSIFHPNELHIATLELQEPRASLIKYEGTDSLNLTTFIKSLNELIVKDTTKKGQPFRFQINELVLANGRFTFDDFNKPRAAHGMDYFHMTIDSLSGRFNEINLDDTLQVRVTDLRASETRSNTRLHNLDVYMTYAPTFWEWDELDLKVNKSNLQDFVRFDYNRFGNFSQFIDSVTVTADLKDSKVYSKDIAVFASQLKDYDENVLVYSAEVKGKVTKFTANNLNLKYGENTHIVGSLRADGLPNFKETFANIRLQPSTINANDLKQFLPKDAYTIAARLGTVKLQGKFLGFYNDFVSNGSFSTALGKLDSDINLKIDDDTRTSTYRGNLKTNNFNLGRLINNTDLVKTISMEGRIAGSGFTLQDARVELDASIRQLHVLDYNYQNIKADGVLSKQKFTGKVSIKDPNLVFTADGDVDLARDQQAFNMVADLQKINLQALRLTKKQVILSANAHLNFKGLRLDDFVGSADFDSAIVTYEGKQMALDSVQIFSEIANGQRSLSLSSDILALKASGDFDYSVLLKDLQQLVQEYQLNFESNDAATRAYYRRKNYGNRREYNLAYDVYLKRVNPVLQLFMPELTISDNSRVEGTFRHGNTVILNMFTRIDTILYGDAQLYRNNIELNTSKLQNSPDVLASASFTSEKQLLPSAGETESMLLEGVWSERTIDFYTSILQPAQNNRATITGDLTFLADRLRIVFDKSNITLRENPWTFATNNTIYISEGGRYVDFENFALSNQNQVITVNGTLSEDPKSRLAFNVQDFDLRNLNPLIKQQIAGSLTAELIAQDIYNKAIVNSVMRIDSFYMDDVLIGNVAGSSDWNNSLRQLAVNVGIERDNKKVLSITGNYNPQAQDDQLDLLAVMDETQIKIVEPLLRPIMSRMEGTMEGRIRVLGKLTSPVLKGSVMVSNGQFMFDYLGTTYRFSDRVYFGPNSISFRNAGLKDIYGNNATVTGGIAHDGFQNMVLDIEARYRNFMILNTTSEQNELYYGTAFATGTASVLGPVENLRINVDARSEANTRLVLPMDNQTDVARKDFIKFVNRNRTDTTGVAIAVEEQKVDLSGINMNFDLDVTDDAYFEIIIDRTTGDVIRGSGSGDIRMTIDTRGEFNMYGTFEVAKGAYNLNLLEGLVSREFQVTPGGTISWNGDPLNGLMNIRATYTQITSLEDITQTGGFEDILNRRYPVTAVVDLKGPLLTPEIKLGLNFDEIPAAAATIIEPLLNGIRNDENELNRQVFSLLVLRRLSPAGTFAALDASTVSGSLGGLLSSQLNTFFNSIDSNLEVDIGLSGMDENDISNLQLRLSYTFFQGRLRVTSQTGVGASEVTGSSGYQGDWSIEYYITKSGELRARLEYNTIQRGYTERLSPSNSQRMSLLHTKRFDNLNELFGRGNPNRRERKREQEQEPIILDSDPRLKL